MACPDENELTAMIAHSGAPGAFADLEAHIDSCDHCRKIVAAAARAETLAMGTPEPPGSDEPLLDLSVGGRYVIEALLGRGGMGSVYLARDVTLGREVALKLHRAGSGGERLHREAVAMAKLAHPNVVTVFEVTSIDDRLCVAMEYVRGDTLRGWRGSRHRTWHEIVALLLDAGQGLAAAHAAGLVHRDFKPENVLVGDDGRPRVGDFGLARVGPEPAARRGVAAALADLDTPMTATGTVLGTPAYMAPEQLAGEPVDARCDQFAFCVVAWECLFGRRPFTGNSLAAIRTAIVERELAAPGKRAVPDRVRRAIERGLATEPADRYADMPELLATLRAAAAPRTRRRVAIAAVALVAIGGGALAAASTLSSRAREAACTAQGDTVRGDFGAFARNAIQRAFAATGAPFAQSAFAHASAVLDRYSEQLAVQTVAACHGGDDSPRIAAARRACLAERAAELVGLVDVLSHADAGVVQRAPNAAWAIFDPAPCNDAHVLLEAPAVPRTPEQAAFLGKLRAFDDAGRYQDGIALAKPQLDAARARGDRDAELDLSLVLGQLDEEVAPPEQIAPIYERALELAEASGRDLDAAVALIRLANLTGSVQHQHAAAHRQLDLARAKLARLGGGNVAIRATLLDTEGEVLMDENRLGEAETALREAAKELAQAYGDDHPQLGNALGTLSEILRGEGKQAESLEVSRHTADVLRRALGDEHPTVAGAELNLATALVWMHRDDEARPLLAHADAVFARTFGDDHPVRAAVYGSLGELERDQSHWDAAIDAFRKALAVLVKLGDVAGQAGARGDLARTLSLAGRGDEAVAEQTKVVAIYEQLGPDGAPRLPAALADLADIDTARGKPALAVPIAERAVALAEARPADANPDDLADARLALAAALWDAGRDRTRARALAEKARAAYTDPARVGRAAQWLADHR